MDDGRELTRALEEITVESVQLGRLPQEHVLSGVRALDLWSEGSSGAMLFWVDHDPADIAQGEPELWHVIVKRIRGSCQVIGHATCTIEPWDAFQAGIAPGLTRFMGGSASVRDRGDLVTWHSARVIWATASPEVATIRLRDLQGNTRERPPGRHGFVLLGITEDDPITYASALDHAGNEIPGEPILL